MTSLNHDFNISSSCLAGNNHALPQYLPNPVHFLSIRRVYFHSNAANHPVKAKAAMFDTDVGSNSRSVLALIGGEAHVLVLPKREAFHRWKLQLSCKRREERSVAIEMLRPPNLTLMQSVSVSDSLWCLLGPASVTRYRF